MPGDLLLGTDLDRTLLPNGLQEYDGSMGLFKRIVEDEGMTLAFVTGRSLGLVKEAMEEFGPPEPAYIVADVGTSIYKREERGFVKESGWEAEITASARGWDTRLFMRKLSSLGGLRLQEKDRQTAFKLSYYVDDPSLGGSLGREAAGILGGVCADAEVVYSFDEKHSIGLLDVLPAHATKLRAMEYLRRRLGLGKDRVVYCGDSGNDVLPLTAGYYSILVRNSVGAVREAVRKALRKRGRLDRLCVARGYGRLNGYYVSGIIEGLIRLGIVPAAYAEGRPPHAKA